MANRVEGERVFCHQCQNEWNRAHGGLQCPRCDSEFVEVVSQSDRVGTRTDHLQLEQGEPETHSLRDHNPTSPQQDHSIHPLRDHNPWAPDPDEDDIDHVPFGGNNNDFSYTRTYTFGGPGQSFNTGEDRAADEVMQNFQRMVTGLLGGRNTHFGGQININGRTTTFGAGSRNMPFGQPFGNQPFGGFDNDVHDNPFGFRQQGPGNAAQDPFPNPFGTASPFGNIFNMLFDPANARSGDAVFTQEAMDRIMSQMMDAQQSNGAPPAPQSLINSLPKKSLDKSMAGDDGKAECSICMDNVDLGTEVTVLPCNHWFHFECIESWLKEHDTCPHCRKPITPEDQRQRTQSTRRSSSVATPVPSDSPSSVRAAREQYYNRRPDEERPSSERRPSRRSTGSQDGSGGVGGWIRSRLPFSS